MSKVYEAHEIEPYQLVSADCINAFMVGRRNSDLCNLCLLSVKEWYQKTKRLLDEDTALQIMYDYAEEWIDNHPEPCYRAGRQYIMSEEGRNTVNYCARNYRTLLPSMVDRYLLDVDYNIK